MGDIKFDTTVGRNVSLKNNRKEVTWTLAQSGGWVYSARALVPEVPVKIVLQGSGHCEVGFVKGNPGHPFLGGRMLKITKMNDIKIHKRTCELSLSLKNNGKELRSDFEGNNFSSKTGQGNVWIAIYVKFGNVTINMFSKGLHGGEERLRFSTSHGSNICLDELAQQAQTISNNPAACCFFKINPRETIELECSPITCGKRDPSRYSLQILATNSCPIQLRRTCPRMFDPCAILGSPPNLTSLELLEKADCKGPISIALYDSNVIEYKTATGKINRQQLRLEPVSGFWIMLQLYRVTVRLHSQRWDIKQTHPKGLDQIDGRVREPMNCYAENSLDVFNEFKEQEYVSITEVKKIAQKADSSYRSLPTLIEEKEEDTIESQEDDEQTQLKSIHERISNLEQSQDEIKSLLRNATGQFSVPDEWMVSRSSTSTVPRSNDEVVPESLKQNWTELVKNLRAESLCDCLFENGVISHADMEEVLSVNQRDQRGANRKLLTILGKKHVRKSLMIQILEQTEEEHLKHLFFPEE